MKVLVIGCKGKIGYEVCLALKDKGIAFIAPSQAELDLTCPEQIQSAIKQYQPSIVVNAASYNDPSGAENEPTFCYRVNRDGSAVLADCCRQQGCKLIHLSSYRVFDGLQQESYDEQDSPNPSRVHAISRWQGEEQIRQRCPEHIILRFSWIISKRRNNILTRLLKQISHHQEVTVTSDQVGCPTPACDAARVVVAIIQQIKYGADAWGTYHYAGTEAISANSFAEIVVTEAANHHHLKVKKLKMNKMDNREGVRPPANAVLNCSSVRNTFGIQTRSWRPVITEIIRRYYHQEKIEAD
ncbi:MAG: sugar nucleotide-binding protein [Endozoicomonas sp. (ex Botrylloides leachii)]|nr:sugar nucleotide-binding protein [Endozoicomonas sp. (ex Botrylloides leachii)]